jgi:peptidyl-dipeptidase Dcp
MSRKSSAAPNINPEIATWTGPLGLPDFARIDDRDFEAAFDAALPADLAETQAIADNPDEPTFENTIVALETAGELLTRASHIFWNLAGANTNDTLQKLECKLSPELSRHRSAIMMNARYSTASTRCFENLKASTSMRKPTAYSN